MDPVGPLARLRAPKGRNPPFGLAPQAPFRKPKGPLALVIVLPGIVLESGAGAFVLLVAPNPVVDSCSFDSPPDIGDTRPLPLQTPGSGRSTYTGRVPYRKGGQMHDKCPETKPRNTAKIRSDLRSKGDTDRGIDRGRMSKYANSI